MAVVAVVVSAACWQAPASATVRSVPTPHRATSGQTAAVLLASSKAKQPQPMFPATGYFSTAEQNGRWYLVTPQGAPFYAAGIDTVAPNGSGTDSVTGQCPYCQTVAADYPSTSAWATATVAQLRSWGFNSLGPYSDDADLRSQMPYEVQLSMASGDDWFAPSFVTNADHVAATQVAPLADDPNVIGYFTDSELDWGPLLGTGNCTYTTALACYLNLPVGSPGQQAAEGYVGDPSGFLTALATRYFSVTTAAVRMYDTHHLILGVKAEGQEIEPNLLKAAAPYVNVFSIEDYDLWPGLDQAANAFWPSYLPVQQNLADFESDFNGPLMIGEYSFMAYQPQTPDTHPGIYQVAPNQQVRTNEYENFLAPLYEDAPWLVGDDWFQYVDEPVNGRVGDLEDDNFGMVDVNGNPYTDIVAGVQLMHAVAAHQYLDSGPVCDSWANTGSGVTCTASMPTSAPSPLTIVTTSLPGGTVGTSYFFGGVYAAGGTPGYKYKVVQGSLPKGLKLTRTTGIISGHRRWPAPRRSPCRPPTREDPRRWCRPCPSPSPPTVKVSVSTTSLSSAKQDKAYSKSVAATGGTEPYAWSITGGALPPGLALGSNGAITGIPSVSGTFTFTVEVVDSSSPTESATGQLNLTVKPAR